MDETREKAKAIIRAKTDREYLLESVERCAGTIARLAHDLCQPALCVGLSASEESERVDLIYRLMLSNTKCLTTSVRKFEEFVDTEMKR